jgi:hypothetical protein
MGIPDDALLDHVPACRQQLAILLDGDVLTPMFSARRVDL